jgi:Holliday junction resolvasome RuvABC endonuclease subunit
MTDETRRRRQDPTWISALDTSLKATGWAAGTRYTDVPFFGLIPAPAQGSGVLDRVTRLEAATAAVLRQAVPSGMVVLESPSYGSSGAGTWERAGLWWLVVKALVDHGTEIVMVAPTARAKFATGGGRAGKTEVAVAVGRMLPSVALTSDDQADALTLWAIGRALVGHPVFPETAYRADVLAAVQKGREK